MVDLFTLFFIHIETRRVFVTGVTANPNGEWLTQQARNFTIAAADMNLGVTHLESARTRGPFVTIWRGR
jgi:putative transposase